MIVGDTQLGGPEILYVGTQAAIEALTGLAAGAHAYATDKGPGWYNGTAWEWIVPGNIEAHNAAHENDGADEISVEGLSGLLADEQNAGKIKGKVVSLTGLSNGNALIYDLSSDTFKPGSASGGTDTDAIHKSGIDEFASLPQAYTPQAGDFLLLEVLGQSGAKYKASLLDLTSYLNGKYTVYNHKHEPGSQNNGGGAQVSHSDLLNNNVDVHTQYFNEERGDARYSQLDHSHDHDDLVVNDAGNTYQHLSGSEKEALTWGDTTNLHRHDTYVPVDALFIYDSTASLWSGASRSPGDYTFRPQDNNHLWPAGAVALHVQLMCGWSAASNSYTCSLRRSSGGTNEIQVRALVANISALINGNIALDASGYFYANVAGAAGSCMLRVLGYYK